MGQPDHLFFLGVWTTSQAKFWWFFLLLWRKVITSLAENLPTKDLLSCLYITYDSLVGMQTSQAEKFFNTIPTHFEPGQSSSYV